MGFEIEFLSVGNSNGDAICVRHGSPATGYMIYVVDGGYAATGQTIIDHVEQNYGYPRQIDHVVLSHADNDHVSGLLDVVRHFDVGTLWMNRPWRYSTEILDAFHGNYSADGLARAIRDAYPLLAELEEIAIAKRIPVREAFAYQQIGAFTVLAPTRARYLELIPQFDRTPTSYLRPEKGFWGRLIEAAKELNWFFETWTDEKLQERPAPTSPSNESCIVQIANFEGRLALLTADAGPVALNEAAETARNLGLLHPPAFVQVPHHGSRRNVTPSTLNTWLGPPVEENSGIIRGTAFCSVGDNKPQYPRKRVSNAFVRRGYLVFKQQGPGAYIRNAYDIDRAGLNDLNPVTFTTIYEE